VAHLDLCARDEKAVSDVGWLLWGLLGGLLGGALYWTAQALASRYFYRRRDKAFLRFVRITVPDAKVIEVITVANSDKQAIENIERRLRESSRTL
jgi:hypothetical protein